MLSAADNELLTRTGPGTPMGDLIRRFWIPALLASEVAEPGGAPVRVSLLGEKLVAFRSPDGSVGLLEARCPHRHASLFWGRNEEGGIRCVYHGWKFASDGQCLEMPAEPEDSSYRERVRAVAYPTHEAAGIIWAYLGPAELKPEFPDFEFARLPEGHFHASKRLQRCNYFQNVEGELDSAHVQFLHRTFGGYEAHGRVSLKSMDETENPVYTIEESGAGLMCVAERPYPQGGAYWRVTPFLMPTFTMVPSMVEAHNTFTAAIPIDDVSSWGFTITWRPERPFDEADWERDLGGLTLHVKVDPETFIPERNRENNFLIDREAQHTTNFTGIMGTRNQDLPVQEDQDGAICDRTTEHLGTTDRAIVAARRLMLRSAKSLQKGTEPPQAQNSAAYNMRSFSGPGTADQGWRELWETAQPKSTQPVS
ncbi:Rieske 2Fe-2S domain-containing protein [Ammonicoccus fulvus]|uniref:Rieske 2Fe-2S domain-containing protein n=1 Tax=Ammonicoccus fulvus TaxID=3138240 RepID=A0ABZ3FN15_9ACTN